MSWTFFKLMSYGKLTVRYCRDSQTWSTATEEARETARESAKSASASATRSSSKTLWTHKRNTMMPERLFRGKTE